MLNFKEIPHFPFCIRRKKVDLKGVNLTRDSLVLTKIANEYFAKKKKLCTTLVCPLV